MRIARWPKSYLTQHTLRQVLIAVCAVILTVTILLHLPLTYVLGSDLIQYFRPATRAWLEGSQPYEVQGYVNPPWALPLMAPFSLGPPRLGYVLYFLFSCVLLTLTIRVLGGGRWSLLGVLISPPVISLLLLGQMDTWVLAGILLGRWGVKHTRWGVVGVALTLLVVKPQVGWLVALLWLSTLPKPALGRASVSCGLVWLLSCLMVGRCWPFGINVTQQLDSPYTRTTLSTLSMLRGLGLPPLSYPVVVAALLGLWAWELHTRRLTEYALSLSLLVGTLCSPYVLRHSFSVPFATTFTFLVKRSWSWGLLCFALTWALLLSSLWIDSWTMWWEAGAWWVVLAGLLFSRRRELQEELCRIV